MNKYVKGILLFAGGVVGGFTICGSLIVRTVMKTESIREAVKRALSDRIEILLFGEPEKPIRPTYASYRDWSNSREYEVKDILFETGIEAENTLDTLKEAINTCGYATVSELYYLADVNSCTYLDNKHGWTNLDKAKVVRLRNGYTLDLPTPLPIN